MAIAGDAFAGHTVVITGTLANMESKDAGLLAESACGNELAR